MLHQSFTAVLERNAWLSGTFTTEPYEVAWAREARWFVRVVDHKGNDLHIEATTQISPDGLYWCDLDDQPTAIAESGVTSWPAREFGNWLRIKGNVTSTSDDSADVAAAKVMIYLALKG